MYKKLILFTVVLCSLTGCASIKPKGGQAVSSLSQAEEKQFYYYYYEALKLHNDGKHDQALEAFQLCYSIDSMNPGLNSDLGMFYASLGFISDATKCFERAVALQPGNWWYSMRLINLLSEQKRWNEAILYANQLQKKFPYKEDVYYMQASLYTQTKQYDKAIGAYEQMEKITGINEILSFEKFRLYVQSGNAKKGITEVDKLIETFPMETRYQVLRGDIYMEQNMPEMAYEIYLDVLEKDPQNAYVYISLSDYYNSQNQPEKALESIVHALKNERLDASTKMEILGKYVENLIADEKKIDEAEELFKLLTERYPLEEQAHVYYAIFLQYQNRLEELKEELETILDINPKNDGAWNQLIQLFFIEKNLDKAIELSSKAIENIPANLRWYIYKSTAQYMQDDYKTALETSLEAIKHFGDNKNPALKSDIYSQMGDMYYQLNDKEKAFESYEKALQLYPSNIGAMNNYAYYLSLENSDLKRAEMLSAKAVEMEPKNSTFLDTYAWVLYKQGSYSLAKFYIQRAVDYLSVDKESVGVIWDHYGDILWKTGNKEKALEMWQKAWDSGLEEEQLKQKLENKSLE